MSEKIAPKFILDDIDVKCYLVDRRGMSQCKMMLHVELITKDQDKGQTKYHTYKLCIHFKYDTHTHTHSRELAGCNQNEDIIRDEHFDVDIEPLSHYGAASTPSCAHDSISSPDQQDLFQAEDILLDEHEDSRDDHYEMLEIVENCLPSKMVWIF